MALTVWTLHRLKRKRTLYYMPCYTYFLSVQFNIWFLWRRVMLVVGSSHEKATLLDLHYITSMTVQNSDGRSAPSPAVMLFLFCPQPPWYYQFIVVGDVVAPGVPLKPSLRCSVFRRSIHMSELSPLCRVVLLYVHITFIYLFIYLLLSRARSTNKTSFYITVQRSAPTNRLKQIEPTNK